MLSRGRSLSSVQELREPDTQKEWKGSLYRRWAEFGGWWSQAREVGGGRPESLCEARKGFEDFILRVAETHWSRGLMGPG